MLIRPTKQTSRTRGRLGNEPARHAATSVAGQPDGSAPWDLSQAFERLHTLIELRVMSRLDEIFENIRHSDDRNLGKTNRRAIRLKEVLCILGIGKSTLYGRLNSASRSHDARMPRPFKLGNGSDSARAPSVWWQSDVIEYLETCAKERGLD